MAKELSLAEFKNARLDKLTAMIGDKKALYCLCAVFNVNYDPTIDYVNFTDYVEQAGSKRFKEYADSEEDVSKEQIDKWRRTWGVGDESKPYTPDDYRQLDEKFEVYSARLEKSGGMDEQQEDTLRTCSRMRLESDKYFVKGGKDNIDMASKLNKMVQEMLASEQLRKKDEKPVTIARVDGITDILAKKYGVPVEMGYEEASGVIAKWMISHHYTVTMDAAENMYLAMLNTARMNDDQATLDFLPEELKIPEELSHEFEKTPNQEEKETYEYLKLKRRNDITL